MECQIRSESSQIKSEESLPVLNTAIDKVIQKMDFCEMLNINNVSKGFQEIMKKMEFQELVKASYLSKLCNNFFKIIVFDRLTKSTDLPGVLVLSNHFEKFAHFIDLFRSENEFDVDQIDQINLRNCQIRAGYLDFFGAFHKANHLKLIDCSVCSVPVIRSYQFGTQAFETLEFINCKIYCAGLILSNFSALQTLIFKNCSWIRDGELFRILLHFKNLTLIKDNFEYVGSFAHGLFNGEGFLTYSDGGKYIGNFDMGRPKSKSSADHGTYIYPNDDVYVGNFMDIFQKKLTLPLSIRGVEYGKYFAKGQYNGHGTLIRINGNKYVGSFSGGRYHGHGTFTHANGDKYIGNFKVGKYDGQGVLSYIHGGGYVGSFAVGKYHGHGTLVYGNGDTYVGEFCDGAFISNSR